MNMKTKKTKQVTRNVAKERAEEAQALQNAALALGKTRKGFLEAAGVRSTEVATQFMLQGFSVMESGPDPVERARHALRLLEELAPRNATESMLALQMMGVHNSAVEFVRRSQLRNQTFEAVDANVTRGVRLMSLFIAQLGAMAKLKGTAGQQKMTVEHVHVHAGGQAIVGPIPGRKESPEETRRDDRSTK
jgi:hypothetical protein